MQWQHGTYVVNANTSITTTPIPSDGRQLTSSPCSFDNGVYIRYEQPELFKTYQVYTDPFHNVPRLDLFKFDGSPMQPLYLVFSPPQMLPTQTLNPTTGAPTATGNSKVKRDEAQHILMGKGKPSIVPETPSVLFDADRWWWAGVGLTALGTVMYMLPTSL
jgi:hypothetical protein